MAHVPPTEVTTALDAGQPAAADHRVWYTTTCPTPTPVVTLLHAADESLDTSTSPPTSTNVPSVLEPIGGDPTWTRTPTEVSEYGIGPGVLIGFWINLNSQAIAAAAQRDLVLAGVLYGIAGGLFASWLVAGATVAIKRTALLSNQTEADKQVDRKLPKPK